jgi:hypothetical protein
MSTLVHRPRFPTLTTQALLRTHTHTSVQMDQHYGIEHVRASSLPDTVVRRAAEIASMLGSSRTRRGAEHIELQRAKLEAAAVAEITVLAQNAESGEMFGRGEGGGGLTIGGRSDRACGFESTRTGLTFSH